LPGRSNSEKDPLIFIDALFRELRLARVPLEFMKIKKAGSVDPAFPVGLVAISTSEEPR
jgi:hypothetical protein